MFTNKIVMTYFITMLPPNASAKAWNYEAFSEEQADSQTGIKR
jgi:hypothetical protein